MNIFVCEQYYSSYSTLLQMTFTLTFSWPSEAKFKVLKVIFELKISRYFHFRDQNLWVTFVLTQKWPWPSKSRLCSRLPSVSKGIIQQILSLTFSSATCIKVIWLFSYFNVTLHSSCMMSFLRNTLVEHLIKKYC